MLELLALSFPAIDPVALQIGPLALRWYSLAYVAGILLGWAYVSWLNKTPLHGKPLLTQSHIDDMISWAVVGVILGGRLGYVFFYKPEYYFSEPLEIVKVWKGGMSFHGGLIGTILAFYLFCRKYTLPFLAAMDIIACAAPIGIFFGRLANFINGELFGRVTDSPLGMVFPHGGELPRHPSQLYEASLEGLALFVLLFFLVKYTRLRERAGALGGVFLLGYSASRALVELFREPDAQLGFLLGGLTMGQLLSLPMMALGLYLIFRPLRGA